MGVYVGKGKIGKVFQELDKWIGNRVESVMTIVGGDFNARIGKEDGGVEEEEEKAVERQ